MKRQRGRGRKSNNSGNRSYESNGPDVKIRGNANQIYEKYLQYARDAQTSGDRVAAEAFFQHAEHYFRIVAANAPKERYNQNDDQNNRDDDDNDRNDDANAKDDSEAEAEVTSTKPKRSNGDDSDVDGLEVVDGKSEAPQDISSESSGDQKDGSSSRRRSSRSRSRRKPTDDAQASQSSDDAGDDDAGLRAMMARSGEDASSAEPVES
ncbi:MAG: hypothetical protein CMK07_14875 [Ponticaulis sp.]|nr:hypothetical protein [Ponticaulis sp.]